MSTSTNENFKVSEHSEIDIMDFYRIRITNPDGTVTDQGNFKSKSAALYFMSDEEKARLGNGIDIILSRTSTLRVVTQTRTVSVV